VTSALTLAGKCCIHPVPSPESCCGELPPPRARASPFCCPRLALLRCAVGRQHSRSARMCASASACTWLYQLIPKGFLTLRERARRVSTDHPTLRTRLLTLARLRRLRPKGPLGREQVPRLCGAPPLVHRELTEHRRRPSLVRALPSVPLWQHSCALTKAFPTPHAT
jgi:hypothetical protein